MSIFWTTEAGFFTFRMSFLSPNWQCHGNDEDSKYSLQSLTHWSHPFVIHELISGAADTAPFMLAPKCQSVPTQELYRGHIHSTRSVTEH